jgi:hypothetical protein
MGITGKRLIVAAGALLGSMFGMSVLLGGAAAQTPKAAGQSEVVMIRCSTTTSDFSVSAYRGSSGAPGKRGENCPEVLSQLLRDGYAISDVGHYDKDSDYVVFLLTRGR